MYKPLLVNVSVSLIVSGVEPHMTLQKGCSFSVISEAVYSELPQLP